ncbi:hypothetical protein [Nostoc sp. ChiQUE01b]|uniref:hypothetical protein n=1 Tax=Nostoc sp. ChiQUE01b TaxID=3075376 RepID=UPI002AD2CA4D|nr:hypothetical protein [Nostoc sp. ChiQUE01b]MDZ8257218.1 hypothetical protein [Nostoc sp. ChiQUE01b]
MERLRISDLSFCEDEVSDLSQVQGGFASGFVTSFSSAMTSKFQSGSNVGGSISGAVAGALAAGVAVGDGKIILLTSTFTTAS